MTYDHTRYQDNLLMDLMERIHALTEYLGVDLVRVEETPARIVCQKRAKK